MKNKNFIGEVNDRIFEVNRHHRTLRSSLYVNYKKKDVLKMLSSKSGCLERYSEHYNGKLGSSGDWIYRKTPKGYRIGCEFYHNTFLNKVKKALLTLK